MVEINSSSVKVKTNRLIKFSLILKLKISAQMNSLLEKALKMYKSFWTFQDNLFFFLIRIKTFPCKFRFHYWISLFSLLIYERIVITGNTDSKHIWINDNFFLCLVLVGKSPLNETDTFSTYQVLQIQTSLFLQSDHTFRCTQCKAKQQKNQTN